MSIQFTANMILVYNGWCAIIGFSNGIINFLPARSCHLVFAPAWVSTVLGHTIYIKCIPANYQIYRDL